MSAPMPIRSAATSASSTIQPIARHHQLYGCQLLRADRRHQRGDPTLGRGTAILNEFLVLHGKPVLGFANPQLYQNL